MSSNIPFKYFLFCEQDHTRCRRDLTVRRISPCLCFSRYFRKTQEVLVLFSACVFTLRTTNPIGDRSSLHCWGQISNTVTRVASVAPPFCVVRYKVENRDRIAAAAAIFMRDKWHPDVLLFHSNDDNMQRILPLETVEMKVLSCSLCNDIPLESKFLQIEQNGHNGIILLSSSWDTISCNVHFFSHHQFAIVAPKLSRFRELFASRPVWFYEKLKSWIDNLRYEDSPLERRFFD